MTHLSRQNDQMVEEKNGNVAAVESAPEVEKFQVPQQVVVDKDWGTRDSHSTKSQRSKAPETDSISEPEVAAAEMSLPLDIASISVHQIPPPKLRHPYLGDKSPSTNRTSLSSQS